MPSTMKIHSVISVIHLEQTTEDEYNRDLSPNPGSIVVDGREEYVVEKIVWAEKRDGKPGYIVKLKEYEDKKDQTWEPENQLKEDVPMTHDVYFLESVFKAFCANMTASRLAVNPRRTPRKRETLWLHPRIIIKTLSINTYLYPLERATLFKKNSRQDNISQSMWDRTSIYLTEKHGPKNTETASAGVPRTATWKLFNSSLTRSVS